MAEDERVSGEIVDLEELVETVPVRRVAEAREPRDARRGAGTALLAGEEGRQGARHAALVRRPVVRELAELRAVGVARRALRPRIRSRRDAQERRPDEEAQVEVPLVDDVHARDEHRDVVRRVRDVVAPVRHVLVVGVERHGRGVERREVRRRPRESASRAAACANEVSVESSCAHVKRGCPSRPPHGGEPGARRSRPRPSAGSGASS